MRISGLRDVVVFLILVLLISGCEPVSPEDPGTEPPNSGSPGAEPPPGNNSPVPGANQKPIAVISPGVDQSINMGEMLFFNGSGSSDPDGNTPLSYGWTFSGAATSTRTSTLSRPGVVNFTEAGIVTVNLVVTDSLGLASDAATITVNVLGAGVNLPPNGSITHDRGDGSTGSSGNFTITAGTNVVFQGNAADPEGDPVSYSWTFPANVSSSSRSGSQVTASFPATGTFSVSLTASDINGNSDPTPAQVTVTVVDVAVNQPPNGSITHDNGTGATGSSGNVTIETGASVVFRGSATDPEGDPVGYSWTFPANVSPSSRSGSQVMASFPTTGTFLVSLTASDNNGNNDPTPAQVTVTVVDAAVNQSPTGSITHDNGTGATGSSGNIAIETGASVVFQGSADDPENDPITYAWNIPANVTTVATPGSQPFTAGFPVAGTYIISLTVSDNNGNSDPTPAQVTVTVTDAPVPVNLPPNGLIAHDRGTGATGSSGNVVITVGSTLVFQGQASDPENDAITYAWTFAGTTASSTTISGPITARYTTVGTFPVTLIVTDNNGNVDPTPAELTVTVTLPAFKFLPRLSDQDGNPNDANATYNLTVDSNVNVNVETLTGSWVTPMMRYNSLQLPPVIVARRGTQMTFDVDNNLGQDTTIHWHGFKIPAAQDGGPDMPIAAGGSRTYQYTLIQPGGSLWFHPHAHGTTATQVYNGLAGALIVTDDITENLENNNRLPSGEQDIALLLQDRSFGADNGSGRRLLSYSAGGGMMGMAGMLGSRMLVNGVEMPELEVSTRQYRFRIYNGSNARTYDVALNNNANFTVVGTDGGLLNSPVVTDHIMLSAGERAEIVVDFGNYNVGENIRLVSRSFAGGGMMGGGGAVPNGSAFELMQFHVDRSASDNVSLYSSLPSTAEINDRLTVADATATRDFVMSTVMQMGVGMQFLINGQTFDMNRIDETVSVGATEIWSISNTSTMAHPFHAHAIQWQILDRNGVPATGVDLGWKDTVLVQPDEMVRFIGRFDPVVNIGTYMYHCHILEHEEAGMMGTFLIQ